MRRSLAALLLVAAVVGYVMWQRPAEPAAPPPEPKPVVLQYADGSKMWSTNDGKRQTTVVKRVLAELSEASLSFDSLRAVGGVVRTTIDARAQTVAAAVIGRLVMPNRESDAAVAAIDPASGGVRVYLPGDSWDESLAGGMPKEPAPGLVLVSQQNVLPSLVTPLDLSVSYATFAADGVQRRPHLVATVTGADGALLHQAAEDPKQVVGADVARQFTARLKENPACNGVACVPDAAPWMVGYMPQLAVALYVKKAGAVDAGLPRLIWQEFLAELAR
ncbi:hypothetical protein ABZ345_40880 [Lentzea sp. NPDC005914]|uniref:hypothetical protein n=1 Tax=Lentzea sp. NPDC005914 TaxID=3154572 RepID=UPI0033EC85DA